MTRHQYRAAIQTLGLSQEAAGVFFGVSKRTGQRYAAEGPPEVVSKFLKLMLKLELLPEDVQ